ncbi:MAG TPA: hypothetical protein P5137_08795 [Candidatus Brocadiia bacterium]|nr:hypothetical protein [Candidatus Brocadiia bacterium]
MKLTGSAKRMLAGIIFVIVTLLLIWRGWSAPDTGDKLFLGVGLSALVGYIFGAVSFWGHGRPASAAPHDPPKQGQG